MTTFSRASVLLLSLYLVAALTGCGGGSDAAFSGASVQPMVGTSTLVVRQSIQAKAVPASINRVVIGGFRSLIVDGVPDPFAGGETFPVREFPLSNAYTIENVPVDTTTIRIQYFEGTKLVGIFVDEVKLQENETFEIVDPSFISRPEVDQFDLILTDGLSFVAPPGERPVVVAGLTYPILQFVVPALGDLETALFEERINSSVGLGSQQDFELSDSIRAFTVFSSTNSAVLDVKNGGVVNTSHGSGTLWPLKAGDSTITANFLGIVKSLDVRVTALHRPFVRIGQMRNLNISTTPVTISRVNGIADLIYDTHIESGIDVHDELIYRPSDKPNVAQWDSAPGREGYIIRGSEVGRVVLWVQHPNNYIWVPVLIENS